jgi:hypothetical protein
LPRHIDFLNLLAPRSALVLIYLDANAYNDVERGLVPHGDVAAFQKAQAARAISTRLSLPDLEEFLGVWNSDRPMALRRLQIARDLAGFDGLLAQPKDILEGAFAAYAAGSPQPSPLMPRRERREIAGMLDKVLRGSRRFDPKLTTMLGDVKASKEKWRSDLGGARENSLDEPRARFTESELRGLPFPEFFNRGAADWALGLAEGRGLGDACQARGVDGLLAVRTVRFCVGAIISQTHTEMSAGRKVDLGDGYDVWHAILAGTVDVFVTNDQRLFDHLDRIPDVAGFRIVKSLGEALAIATRSRLCGSCTLLRTRARPTGRAGLRGSPECSNDQRLMTSD